MIRRLAIIVTVSIALAGCDINGAVDQMAETAMEFGYRCKQNGKTLVECRDEIRKALREGDR